MATLSIIDVNDRSKIIRGSIGTLSAISTTLTWFDMGNPGAIFPFQSRLAGANPIAVSVEGTFVATFQIFLSLQDTAPATTPAGAAISASWPTLGSVTVSTLLTINEPARWIAFNCSAFTSGSATAWVYGVLPS